MPPKILRAALAERTLVAATFTDPRVPDAANKVIVRPLLLRGEPAWQIETHRNNQATHRNVTPADVTDIVAELCRAFRQANVATTDSRVQIALKGDGVVKVKTLPMTAAPAPTAAEHNRAKQYLLPENVPTPFLHRVGVMTETGAVVAARRAKFRQVNRFLEMVEDVLPHLPPTADPLRVVDFGSGKAYLTFALYHLLREIHGRDVTLRGLDLKAEVVADCNRIAADLGWNDRLRFAEGEIRGFQTGDAPDMVVCLHACDTATDDALAQAVAWGSRVILAVPCCQHELFRQVESADLHALFKHGILKERVAALATDALRAVLLETVGYDVQVMEFIETEHTPKNVLIRAVRARAGARAGAHREAKWAEYKRLRDALGVGTFQFETALREAGLLNRDGSQNAFLTGKQSLLITLT